MLDGQNVFGDEGSFAGGWHAHEAAAKVAVAPVIVAVEHGGVERIAELGAPSSPKLAALIDLIVERIVPEARARTPIRQGACFVAGSSMGGLAALYMHFRRPDVFGGAIAMSPSLWFDRRSIFTFIDAQTNPYKSRIYLDAGAREAGGRLVTLTEAMAERLRARGWADEGDLRISSVVDPRGTHTEKAWRRRLPKALRFVFGS